MQRFWRIALIVVAVIAAAGITGLGVAYTLGVFADEGRFRAAPDCSVLDASSVAAVVPAAKIEGGRDNSCAASDGQTQINVGFTVVSKKGTVGAPELAARLLDAVGGGNTERLSGVGDQAIRQRTQAIGQPQIITMRVSNLIVVVSVANLSGGDLPATAESGVLDVAKSLARNLGGTKPAK